MTSQTGLVGRSTEQAALRSLLDVVREGLSGALVLRGEAGVGKTALLNDTATAATECQVARVSGIESETRLGFAGLYRLLAPFLTRVDRLPRRHRTVLSSALGLTDGPSATPYLVGMATLTLLAEAAESQPVLCLVDDTQWLDHDSREALAFVARRLHAERTALVFARTEPTQLPQLDGIPELYVDRLDHASATTLLARLTHGHLDQQIAERLSVAADGNPLALTELGRMSAIAPVGPAMLRASPVPIGQRLERHFRRAVEHLPDDCRLLLLLLAAAQSDNATLVWRGADLEGIEPTALVPAEAAGLIDLQPTLQFRHGLMRNAVFQTARPGERRRAYQLLARLTDRAETADQRSWYLATAAFAPDETLAAELERHAATARSRGGFLDESAFLTRAAELSPDPASRARRYVMAATAAVSGGAPHQADQLLEAGGPYSVDPLTEARAAQARARATLASTRPRNRITSELMEAAKLAAPVDAALTQELLLGAIDLALVAGDRLEGVTAQDAGQLALTLRPRVVEKADLPDLLLDGLATLIGVGYVEAAPTLRRAVTAMAAPDALGDGLPDWHLMGFAAAEMLWDIDAALSWTERCEKSARQAGALYPLIVALLTKSHTEARAGHVKAALATAADGRHVAHALGWGEDRKGLFNHPGLLGLQGQDEAARAAADHFHSTAILLGAGAQDRLADAGMTLLHIARRNYERAFTMAEAFRAAGAVGLNDALPALVESGVRTGRHAEAAEAVNILALRVAASHTNHARCLLAQSRALIASDAAAEAHYQEAIDLLRPRPASLNLGRSHLLYGEWLRRQKRRTEARSQLRQAHDMFVELGIVSFADRASSELAAEGARVDAPATSRTTGLTEQEENVARLAARGATNQEIATELFISTHTVDYHLGKIFRKLGVRSRRRLADALAQASDAPTA